jgi:5-methylcytosine-specific restriction endonuclease McrA
MARRRRHHWINPRDQMISAMGFNSYEAYLASPLWIGIRSRVFHLKGSGCVLCDSRAEEVHHRKYTRPVMLGHDLRWLEPLCRSCHRSIEFFPSGRKRPFRLVDKLFRLRKKRKARRGPVPRRASGKQV